MPGGTPSAFTPAAGLLASVRDLARFDAALDAGSVVSDASRTLMFTPARTAEGTAPYGLGWQLGESLGVRWAWHAGLWSPSASALYVKAPDLDLTLLALANTDALTAPHALVGSDPTAAAAVAAFVRAFVGPAAGFDVPPVDWRADAATLIARVGEVGDDRARDALGREALAWRQAYAFVGDDAGAARLLEVHRVTFPGPVDAARLDLRTPPRGPAPRPPLPTDADLAAAAGTYRLASAPPGVAVPPSLTVAATGTGLATFDGRTACTAWVPVTSEAFIAPAVPGSLAVVPRGEGAVILASGAMRVVYLRDAP